MSRSLPHYVKVQLAPRRGDILKSTSFWGSILIAIAVWLGSPRLWSGEMTFAEIYHAIMAYAAVVIGFSVAAMTLLIGMSSPQFASLLAAPESGRSTGDSLVYNKLARLIFVYSWTAVVHWIILVASIVLLILNGDSIGRDKGVIGLRSLPVSAYLGMAAYGLGQFLSSIFVLSQHGEDCIKFLLKERGESGGVSPHASPSAASKAAG